MGVSSGGADWGAFIWGDGTLWAHSIVWGGGELWGDAAHFGSGAIWLSGQQIPSPYAVSWAAPLVFEKMQLQVSVTASEFVGVGTFYARYQQTGYMVPTSITVSSIAGTTGFGTGPGAGVGIGPGVGIQGITVQESGVAVGTIAGINTINFTGAGQTATGAGAIATVNIPGGGGGGGIPSPPANSIQFDNAGVFGGSSHLLWNSGLQAVQTDTGTSILMAGVGVIQQGVGSSIVQNDTSTLQTGNTSFVTWGQNLTWTTDINMNWTVQSGSTVTIGANASWTFGFTSILTLQQGSKIMGDMSNATLANRLTFQSTTLNGNSIYNIIPNGAGTAAGIQLYNASDFSNHSRLAIQARTTGHILNSVNLGTGAIQPIQLAINGTPGVQVTTSFVTQVVNGFSRNVVTKTTTYAATINDSIIFADTTGAAWTLTLPAANGDGAGFSVGLRIKRIDSSVNNLTISRAGADTIDGATTLVLGALQAADLESDGVSKWGVM